MEDQKGGVAPPEEGRTPVKEKPDPKRRLTVMILGSVGKVRSFHISSRIVFWGTLFSVGYIVFSLFIINSYIQMRGASHTQGERISQLEIENAANKKTLLRSKQHITLLEDYIRNLEGGEQAGGPAKGLRPQEAEPKAVAESPAKDKARQAKSSVPSDIVEIADMVIQREGARLTVNFKLVNAHPEETAVGGYVHIVAMNRQSDPPKEWSYPQEKLENGKPANYRAGQIFLIQRYKQIQGRFNLGSSAESPSLIKLLVYDQAGALVLERDFEVRQGTP